MGAYVPYSDEIEKLKILLQPDFDLTGRPRLKMLSNFLTRSVVLSNIPREMIPIFGDIVEVGNLYVKMGLNNLRDKSELRLGVLANLYRGKGGFERLALVTTRTITETIGERK